MLAVSQPGKTFWSFMCRGCDILLRDGPLMIWGVPGQRIRVEFFFPGQLTVELFRVVELSFVFPGEEPLIFFPRFCPSPPPKLLMVLPLSCMSWQAIILDKRLQNIGLYETLWSLNIVLWPTGNITALWSYDSDLIHPKRTSFVGFWSCICEVQSW